MDRVSKITTRLVRMRIGIGRTYLSRKSLRRAIVPVDCRTEGVVILIGTGSVQTLQGVDSMTGRRVILQVATLNIQFGDSRRNEYVGPGSQFHACARQVKPSG